MLHIISNSTLKVADISLQEKSVLHVHICSDFIPSWHQNTSHMHHAVCQFSLAMWETSTTAKHKLYTSVLRETNVFDKHKSMIALNTCYIRVLCDWIQMCPSRVLSALTPVFTIYRLCCQVWQY